MPLTQQGHTHDPSVVRQKIVYGSGSSGVPDGSRLPEGLHVALSGVGTTSSLARLKGRRGVCAVGEPPPVYANYMFDDMGFWVVIAVDADCTLDRFQVEWMVHWLRKKSDEA